MLKKLAKTLAFTSILTCTAVTLVTPSHADGTGSDLITYSPNAISKIGVNSSGAAYEMKGLMDIAASVKVEVSGGISGHVKSWKTWLLVKTENTNWVEFSNNGASKSYPVFNRPQNVKALVSLAVPHMTLAPVMVSYCNAMADDLRSQGKSNTEIFSQDRTVPIAITSAVSAKYIPIWTGSLYQDPGQGFTGYPIINLVCKGRPPTPPIHTAGSLKPEPVDFKINDIDLFLTTFSGGNTQPNPASICKKAQVKVRLKTSKAGATKFKLWTKVGGVMTSKVIDAWASHDGNGGFKAEHTEWVSVNKPTNVQAKAEEMVSGFGSSTAWKDITLQCTNPGGGGIATNPNPHDDNDIPQAKNVDGDFAFIDYGSPKCTRKGKALITFRSPKPDNIHYSLDCKFDNHSGVLPTVPHADGGYAAATLVSFDVDKTYTEACTLRTVAPYGPEDHVNKTHLFQCVTPSGHSASNDVQVDSHPNQPSSNPDIPAKLVNSVPTQNPTPPWICQGGMWQGHNGCKCPVHKKLIYTQIIDHGIPHNGSKCVERDIKPGTSSPTPPRPVKGLTTTDKAKSNAIKHRLKAEKKKKALAIAAANARQFKIKQAAIKLRKLKLQQKAVKARQLKIQQATIKRAAAAVFVKRKAVTLKKQTAPVRSNPMTRKRALRRR